MPNLEPWMKQQSEGESLRPSKFENPLLSIRDERQKMICANCHPTYNEPLQKIIELKDWTLEKYKVDMENAQQNEEKVIDDIIKELKEIAIHKQQKTLNDYNSKVSITSSNLLIASFILFGFTVGTFNIS
jgi:hypothetical protein